MGKRIWQHNNTYRTNFNTWLTAGAYTYNEQDYGRVFPPVWESVEKVVKRFPDVDVRVEKPVKPKFEQLFFTDDRAYQYQKQTIGYMVNNPRCIVADEVGLGKTMQSLLACKILYKHSAQEDFNVLVLTRKSLPSQWLEEIARWGDEDWSSWDFSTSSHTHRLEILDYVSMFSQGVNVVVAHHENVNKYLHEFCMHRWDCIIVDEAHRFKNRNAKRTKNLRQLCLSQKESSLYLLTGTPQEKSCADMWALLNLIDPKTFSSYWAFYNCFVETEKIGDYDIVKGSQNVDVLHSMIDDYYTKNTRQSCGLQLPQTQQIKYPVQPTKDQKKLFRILRKESYIPEFDLEITNGLARMHYERFSCSNMRPDGTVMPDDPKIEALIEITNSMPNDKVLIFSSYRTICHRLAYDFECPVYMAGEDPQIIDDFKTSKDRFLVATPQSMGEGINLTECKAIVFYDVPVSSTVNRQGIGRIDRIGQDTPPIIFYLCIENSIEDHVFNMLSDKNRDFDQTTIVKELYSEESNG